MLSASRHRVVLAFCAFAPLSAAAGWAACTTGAKQLRVPEDCATVASAVTALAHGGTIDIATGTYLFGSGGLNLGGKNKAMTLAARVSGAVAFSGQHLYPVVRIGNSATNGKPITFEGIRFVNGYSASGFQAGGVTMKNAQVTFADCAFEDHKNDHLSTGGGALGLYGGSRALVVRSSFTDNRARNQGGAIYVYTSPTDGPSSLWVHASTFTGNSTAFSGFTATAAGGAIYARNAKVFVADSRFDANRAGWVGGAIYAWGDMRSSAPACSYDSAPSADILLTRTSFTHNRADDAAGVATVPQTQGGAIHAENCVRVRVYASIFEENGANWGGAISLDHSKLAVEQSVFRYNYSTIPTTAYAIGGAVFALARDMSSREFTNGEVIIYRTLFQGRRLGSSASENSQMGGCLKTIGDASKPMPIPASARLKVTVTDSAFYDCAVDQFLPALLFVGGGAIDVAQTELILNNVLLARNSAVASPSTVTGKGSGISARDDSRVSYGNNVVFAGGVTDGIYGDVYLANRTSATGSFTSSTATQSSPLLGMLVAAPSRPAGGPWAGTAELTWGFAGTAATINGGSVGTNPKNGRKSAIEGAHTLVVAGLASCARCTVTISPPISPATTLAAAPVTIAPGATTALSWTTPAGTFLASLVDQGLGERSATGSASVSPKGSTTYRRFALTAQGGALAEERVYVGEAP